MSAPAPRSPAHVPTLTEVVQLDAGPPPKSASDFGGAAPLDVSRIIDDVMAQAQLELDRMLEQRLREALAPALARVADALAEQLRDELAAALRDIVAGAVTREIARHRED